MDVGYREGSLEFVDVSLKFVVYVVVGENYILIVYNLF